jgi:hypothetical protein
MSAKPRKTDLRHWLAAVIALWPASYSAGADPAPGSLDPSLFLSAPAFSQNAPGASDNPLLQVSCPSCGNGLLGSANYPASTSAGCAGDSCEGGCVPGQRCTPCEGTNCISRTFCAFYDCICCPDPCYEPRWIAAADSAFFVSSARPVTQMRIGWDSGINMILPDRAEYFWAAPPKGPPNPETKLNYSQLSIYNEAAVEKFSIYTNVPYLSLDPSVNNGAAGFGDITIGTKSMFLDCELMQMSFQMATTLPSGNFLKGLGTGHVSLEPSLLFAVKLCPDTYVQVQLSEWVPIGGTDGVQGSILHYHLSLNHVICRPVGDTQLIGTLEFSGYSFQSGAYTDPTTGALQKGDGYTYASIGPGVRFVICDKIDFGFGTAFSVTGQHFADQLYRTEFRWRF